VGAVENATGPLLTRGDIVRVFLRMLFLQGLLHARGMQNLALMHALAPALDRFPESDTKSLLGKHLQFFNCNPNFAPLVAGGVLRLEEERLAGKPVSDEDIAYFKRSLSSPLAAMGDLLFLGSLKPLALTLACISAIYSSFIGLVATWLLYNGVVVSCRLWGVYFGYARGWELVDVFSGPAFQRLLGIVQSIGASVAGALVAVILYRLPGAGTWLAAAGVGLLGLSVLLLRKGVSSSRFAIVLLPIVSVLAILFNR
jgi:PTS system mannose-specific IID component